MRRFSSVSFHDLVGYGFEGIISSIDRGDEHSPTFSAYIMKYCYLSTLSGALQMIGINRKMMNDYRISSDGTLPCEVILEPSKIDQFIEATQDIVSNEDFDKLFHYIEIKWFIKLLPKCLERQILIKLLNHHSVVETAKILNIPTRKIRKIAIHIALVYRLAFMGHPFEHLLTEYDPSQAKHFYITLHSPLKPAFSFPTSVLYRNRRKFKQ
jgi:hypothetical protein